MMMRKMPKTRAFNTPVTKKKGSKLPDLNEFVSSGDYTGAIALLEFKRRTEEDNGTTLPWLGYCAFHLGDYKKALDTFQELSESKSPPENVNLNLATCYFYLQVSVSAYDSLNSSFFVPFELCLVVSSHLLCVFVRITSTLSCLL